MDYDYSKHPINTARGRARVPRNPTEAEAARARAIRPVVAKVEAQTPAAEVAIPPPLQAPEITILVIQLPQAPVAPGNPTTAPAPAPVLATTRAPVISVEDTERNYRHVDDTGDWVVTAEDE